MREPNGWKTATLVMAGLWLVSFACLMGMCFGSVLGFALAEELASSDAATPVPQAERVPQSEERGGVWLGVVFQMTDAGARVQEIIPGSPAAATGLREGDVITALNGTALVEGQPLDAVLRAYRPGDHITVAVLRGAQTLTLEITLAALPEDGFGD